MKHFILNSGPDRNGSIRLEGDDYHYLVRVRRLAPGEYFPALLPSGEETLVQVRSVENGVLLGQVSAEAPPVAAPVKNGLPALLLLQALPRAEKMDLIVRQAAEGALGEIVPFTSEFSVPKLTEGAAAKKRARWERIIKEARQQSGSAVATIVRPPVSIDGLFAFWETVKKERPRALGILFHHEPLAQASLHRYLDSGPETVAIAIGPEGGFSAAEAARFLEAGFKPLTIGDTVLRAETAALYAAAAIRTILLEKDSWEMKPPPPPSG